MENPFRPTAGATPPDLIGRGGVLDEFAYGLRIGSGAPGLLTIFTGARGIGKTVMLGAAEDLALGSGWAVISETATTGFVGRIGESMRRLTNDLGDGPTGRRITAVSLAGFSVTTQLGPEEQVDWRTGGVTLLRLLAAKGTGLIITVDEIHAADRPDLSRLAADVQHFIREGLPIGLVFAGLPAAVSDLLNEGVATFLRRADRIDLHAASIAEVERSFSETFAGAGIGLSPHLAKAAAEATGGYPFLIQLVGLRTSRGDERARVALGRHVRVVREVVQDGIEAATELLHLGESMLLAAIVDREERLTDPCLDVPRCEAPCIRLALRGHLVDEVEQISAAAADARADAEHRVEARGIARVEDLDATDGTARVGDERLGRSTH